MMTISLKMLKLQFALMQFNKQPTFIFARVYNQTRQLNPKSIYLRGALFIPNGIPTLLKNFSLLLLYLIIIFPCPLSSYSLISLYIIVLLSIYTHIT